MPALSNKHYVKAMLSSDIIEQIYANRSDAMPRHYPSMGPVFEQYKRLSKYPDLRQSVVLWVPDTEEWQNSKFAVYDNDYANDMRAIKVAERSPSHEVGVLSYRAARDTMFPPSRRAQAELTELITRLKTNSDNNVTNLHESGIYSDDLKPTVSDIDAINTSYKRSELKVFQQLYYHHHEIRLSTSLPELRQKFIQCVQALPDARPSAKKRPTPSSGPLSTDTVEEIQGPPTKAFDLVRPHLRNDDIGYSNIRSCVDIEERMVLFHEVITDYNVVRGYDRTLPPDLAQQISGFTLLRPNRFLAEGVVARALPDEPIWIHQVASPVLADLLTTIKSTIRKSIEFWPNLYYSRCILMVCQALINIKAIINGNAGDEEVDFAMKVFTPNESTTPYQFTEALKDGLVSNTLIWRASMQLLNHIDALRLVQSFLEKIETKYATASANAKPAAYYVAKDMYGSTDLFSLFVDSIYLHLCALYNVPSSYGPALFKHHFWPHKQLWVDAVTSMARKRILLRGTTSYHDPTTRSLIFTQLKKVFNVIDLQNKCAQARVRQEAWGLPLRS